MDRSSRKMTISFDRQALQKEHRQTLETELDSLVFGDFHERWDAAKRLPTMGDKVIEPMLSLLQEDDLDWEVRWFAARILGEFPYPEVIEALLQLLRTANLDDLRQGAVDALSRIGPPAVLALSNCLHIPEQRLQAAAALAKIRHSSTVEPLMSLAQDKDPQLRTLALEALGSYRSASILPVLLEALNDCSVAVRLTAIKAIPAWREQAEVAKLAISLQPSLDDLNLEVAQAAALALSRLPCNQAIAALTKILASAATPLQLQKAVVRALGWMETPEALSALVASWENSEEPLRSSIVQAVASQPVALEQAASSALLSWLTHARPPQLLQECALALGRLGEKRAWEPLQKLQQHEDEGVRLHVQAALRQLEAVQTGPIIEQES